VLTIYHGPASTTGPRPRNSNEIETLSPVGEGERRSFPEEEVRAERHRDRRSDGTCRLTHKDEEGLSRRAARCRNTAVRVHRTWSSRPLVKR